MSGRQRRNVQSVHSVSVAALQQQLAEAQAKLAAEEARTSQLQQLQSEIRLAQAERHIRAEVRDGDADGNADASHGIASGTGLSAMDCVAFLLDLRLLCFFEEYFPDESERDAAVQHLREWHCAYHLQCQYYEFEHGCPDGLLSVLYSTPASSRAASAGLDRFRRTSTLTAQASSAAPPEATANVFDEALANAQEEADWENWWPQWRQYSRDVEWRYVFPGFEKWKDLGPEERPHVVRHLIELPYLDHLIDLVDQMQFGMFALLGIQCCGSHLASAFSERVNSAGGRVVTLDRLNLGGRSVELETQLKINNSAREFFHQEFKAEYASATDAAPVISAFRQLTKADVEERFAGELEDSD